MLVTVCVIAYNEGKVISDLLDDIKAQTYPHAKMEILLIDSMSTDNTKAIMIDFKKQNHSFKSVQVFDNTKKKQAPGWNVALSNYKGDVIIKIDAHATIPDDFISKNIELLKQGEYVCGGQRPSIVVETTPWRETLLLAEQSMFGSSIANYRRGQKKAYVKSIFHGAYRREVFDAIGYFNENLGRTEDNEIHFRIRKAGYNICYSPEIISYQHIRNTLKSMLKQKFGNGYWVVLTLKVCPRCISFFHLVPLMFVLAIILTTFLLLFVSPVFACVMWSIYCFAALIMSLVAVCHKKRSVYQIALPILFFLLHLSYGTGGLIGLFRLPFWNK